MLNVRKSALVPYSVESMYELVADVDAYPQFLPGVHAVQVHQREPTFVKASIQLAKGPVRKWFTTINRMVPNERMDLSLVEGPFRHLQGHWRFEALGDAGSKVSMHMEFEFASRMLERTIGPVFHDMTNRLVDAFVRRAGEVYGRR